MKRKLFIASIISVSLFLGGCFENNSQSKVEPQLEITKAEWTTETYQASSLTFGSILLHVTGTTNCSKVTVRTSGDGVVNDHEIKVVNNKFDANVGISFTHCAVKGESTSDSTTIKGYLNSDVKTVKLQSGDLKY